MKRRQFLKAMVAVPLVATVGARKFGETSIVLDGDPRNAWKMARFAGLYGMRGGKSRAADIAAYKAACSGKRVLLCSPKKSAVIQMANADFLELEARVLSLTFPLGADPKKIRLLYA